MKLWSYLCNKPLIQSEHKTWFFGMKGLVDLMRAGGVMLWLYTYAINLKYVCPACSECGWQLTFIWCRFLCQSCVWLSFSLRKSCHQLWSSRAPESTHSPQTTSTNEMSNSFQFHFSTLLANSIILESPDVLLGIFCDFGFCEERFSSDCETDKTGI